MKQTVEEAAREYAENLNYSRESQIYLFEKSFIAGAKWREAQIPEHISTVQDCELAVKETKKKAIDALREVVKGLLHDRTIAYVIDEFEELINKEEPHEKHT